MAKAISLLFLAAGFLILSSVVIYADISVPDVGPGVCEGGFTVSGEYIPKDQGGCCSGIECCAYAWNKGNPACDNVPDCSGTECCKYDDFKNLPLCANYIPPACTDVSCCKGIDCCKFPEYKDHPMCSCKGTDCCQYPEYANTLQCTCTGLECCKVPEFSNSPECTCKGQDCCIYQEYASDPSCECVGLECCELPAFKANPMCSCVGTECCKYEEYEGEPQCKCEGTDCCKLDMFKDTPQCVVNQTPEDYCNPADAPECPTGGAFSDVPMLRDPHIGSASLCRGACGPDCPKTCINIPSGVEKCIPDNKGKCFYKCKYNNVISCGVSDGCTIHDNCYDDCAAKGEKNLCNDLGAWVALRPATCHCGCDIACFGKYNFNCFNWMDGYGPYDYFQQYSDEPEITGPFKSC